jgi:hypothetical protein
VADALRQYARAFETLANAVDGEQSDGVVNSLIQSALEAR